MNLVNIYALYVAINNYAHIRNLGGCINDANNLKQYVEIASAAQNWKLKSCELHDEQATKVNIVKQFIKHLEQATINDICLFYFSGHGGQEDAHPAFIPHEPDSKLEVLACYDSNLNHQGSFLADKELRYLIHQLYIKTKAQIITIFDCCHSGSNTRGELIARRLMDDAKGRAWKDFIFADAIDSERVQNLTALEDAIPQGKHIHLAACENKQSAYEYNGRGIFTSNLVNLLQQSKGAVSYQNLISALQLKIQGNYKQTPQLYAIGDEDFIYQSFLGGITEHQKQMAPVIFNTNENAWLLDMGAIHGITKSNTDIKIEVQNTDKELFGKAKLTDVLPNYSLLQIDNALSLDKTKLYRASISGIINITLNVYCYGEKDGISIFKNYLNEHFQKVNFSVVDTPHTADYFVLGSNNTYTIQQPHNKLAVTKTLEGYNKSKKTLITYLQHITQWTFLKNLHNPHTKIKPDTPIDIQFFAVEPNGKNNEIEMKNSKVSIPFQYIPDRDSSEKARGALRVKLSNNTKKAYYCTLLHLSQKEIWVMGRKNIPIEQEPYIKHFNWEAETSYFKLIVSTESFNTAQLAQEELPKPNVSDTDTKRGGKALYFVQHKPPKIKDWTSQLIELNIPNPYYRK